LPDGKLSARGLIVVRTATRNRSIASNWCAVASMIRIKVSAEVIKNWVRRTPEDGRGKLLYSHPSYVFLREVSQVPRRQGRLAAMKPIRDNPTNHRR